MRKLIPILLFIPFLAQADGLVQSYFVGNAKYTVYMTTGPEGGKHYTEYSDLGGLPVPIAVRFWSNYTWSTSIGDINITNANIGATLHGGDTVFIPSKSGGYRSFSMSKIGTLTEGSYITIWAPTMYITPNPAGNLFANSYDSCNWVHLYGPTMRDHTDPFFSYHGTTGHSHYMFFDSITCINNPGFFITGDPVTSLTAYSGSPTDTVNMFYHTIFRKILTDSTGSATHGGLSAIWIGGMETNNIWDDVEIELCSGDSLTSPFPDGPGSYVHMANCYYVRLHDNVYRHLGVVPTPEGHASVFSVEHSHFYAYNNKFINNFGNCLRAISQGCIPALFAVTRAHDPTYDGVSRFYCNIDDSSRKYPMIEDQMDTLYQSPLIAYYQFKRSARIWNNTMYFPGVGVGNSPYDASLVDWYDGSTWVDTIEFHNNVEVGPLNDTSPTVGNAFFHYFMYPNGLRSGRIDSGNNSFFQASVLATSGLANSTTFQSANTGFLYNMGITTPTWLIRDFYGNTIPQAGRSVDIGAAQYPSGNVSPKVQITIGSLIKSTNTH